MTAVLLIAAVLALFVGLAWLGLWWLIGGLMAGLLLVALIFWDSEVA